MLLFFTDVFLFNSSHNSFGVAPWGQFTKMKRRKTTETQTQLQLFQVAKRAELSYAVSFHLPALHCLGQHFQCLFWPFTELSPA